jgi:hypothetical protein
MTFTAFPGTQTTWRSPATQAASAATSTGVAVSHQLELARSWSESGTTPET